MSFCACKFSLNELAIASDRTRHPRCQSLLSAMGRSQTLRLLSAGPQDSHSRLEKLKNKSQDLRNNCTLNRLCLNERTAPTPLGLCIQGHRWGGGVGGARGDATAACPFMVYFTGTRTGTPYLLTAYLRPARGERDRRVYNRALPASLPVCVRKLSGNCPESQVNTEKARSGALLPAAKPTATRNWWTSANQRASRQLHRSQP